ncbi:unnamed protein product [Effrenium voratum]|nr:unnamed protein product [Effrenium voratum]|mmetsp:Transcript_32829/g.78549  ORF Transcript_32829/g.78549 Transcript_32829/m.78549 type:complete len:360 (+) Transcript_32829:98-1177(+)
MGQCVPVLKNQLFDDFVPALPRMDGKSVAVTGCTSGTGKIFAKVCAQKGARVVMLNRDSQRAQEAFAEMKAAAAAAEAPEPLFVACDLTSFQSVRAAGTALSRDAGLSEKGLDVLCNNAGIMGFPDVATEDKCDVQMQSNHLSHFLLTNLCMPLLGKAADLRGEARVVNHSSALRVMDDDNFSNELDPKFLEKNGGNLGGNSETIMKGANFHRYQQTKLANVVFTYALHDRLQAAGSKIKSLCAHPGVAQTQLSTQTMKQGGAKDMQKIPSWAMKLAAYFMFQTEEDGACGILRQALAPEAKSREFFGPLGKGGNTGKYDKAESKGPVGVLAEQPLAHEKAREMLWRISEEVTGQPFVV